MNKKRVQEQFGVNASAYATSAIHAKGATLSRLIDLVRPQPDWQMLDVATAAGHTAHAFASHTDLVAAIDITPQMLPIATNLAIEKGIDNIAMAVADAEQLPFASALFDLLTCRIAAHHFSRLDVFMSESARVLRPGGLLAVVDNIVPGSELRGKMAQRLRDAGSYINAFERLRDPSHVHCSSLNEWRAMFLDAGFQLEHQETIGARMDFLEWAARMQVAPENVVRLQAMLRQAPDAVAEFLEPRSEGQHVTFVLVKAILIGSRT